MSLTISSMRISNYLIKLAVVLTAVLLSTHALTCVALSNETDRANELIHDALYSSLVSGGMAHSEAKVCAARYAFFCTMMTNYSFCDRDESRELLRATADAMGTMLSTAGKYYGSFALSEAASLMLLAVRAGADPAVLSEEFAKIVSSGASLNIARDAVCAAAEAVRVIRPKDGARELLSIAADMAVAQSSNDDIASRMSREVEAFLETRRISAKKSVRDDDQNGGDPAASESVEAYASSYDNDSTASTASAASTSDSADAKDEAQADGSESVQEEESEDAQEPSDTTAEPADDAQAEPQADKKE